MTKILYQGRISHSEKTIEQLYKTQYFSYEKPKALLRVLAGLALILAAVATALPIWAKVLLLMGGAWLVVSREFPAVLRADRALAARSASLPDMEYSFDAEKVRLAGEGSMDIPYGRFTRLVEDADYFYLFIEKNSVCMIERASITPGQEGAFMQFIAERTGLGWRKEKSFLQMTAKEVLQSIRDARKE